MTMRGHALRHRESSLATGHWYRAAVLAGIIGFLQLTGCKSKTIAEIASNMMPKDVVWTLSADRIATSLADVNSLWFEEVGPDNVVLRRSPFGGTFDHNIPSCARFSGTDPFADIVNINNLAMTQNPDLNSSALRTLNNNVFGKFAVLNTQALWFARSSNGLALAGGVSAPKVVTANISADSKQQSMELVAAVATVQFIITPEYAACVRDGYTGSAEAKNALAAFKASSKPNSRVHAVQYRSLVLGSMIGLLLKEVEFKSSLAANAPPSAYNAKFSVDLSADNVSLNYRQYGLYSNDLTLKSLLKEIDENHDPMAGLNLMRNSTQKMAVIAVEPAELPL